MKAIPNRAEIFECHTLHNEAGKEYFWRVMFWEASKGYKTNFLPVKHYAFQMLENNIFKTALVTTSERKKNKILEHWQLLQVS